MAFTEDVTVLFADFGEDCTVAGVGTVGIFDTSTDVAFGDVLTQAPALHLPASVAAAVGDTVVVRGTSYTVRQVLAQPPDGVVRILVLAEA